MARTDQPHKLAFETFVARCTDFSDPVNEKHKTIDYDRPETRAAWNGRYSKVPLWCTVHGEFFTQLAANHLIGQGCPKCGKEVYKAKRRKSDPVGDFRKVHGDVYDYSRVAFVNVHTPVEIVCRKHGAFRQKPNNHLRGDGCPSCWEERRRAFGTQRNDDYKATYAERASRVHNGAYAILKLPEHSHDTVRLLCPKHGEFEQKAFSHLDGHGCWTCGQYTNHTQLEVAAFVEGLGVHVEHEDREVLGGLHIDIWAPERKLGIEYHGSYWHTEDRVGNKHRQKWERAEAAGVRLIQMFDFEWEGRREAVENRLRAMLSADPSTYARKCEVVDVDAREAAQFLKRFHTQGATSRFEVAYGLRLDGELLAVMTLGPNRFRKPGWEVLRYASKGRVQGGFSRLFTHFVRQHTPDRVTSYCDLRWGDGGVYRQAGFSLDGVTDPDYWYVNERGARIGREKLQGAPAGFTQRQWAEQQGYKKVLGVGHQRWVWTP